MLAEHEQVGNQLIYYTLLYKVWVWLCHPPVGYSLFYPTTWISRLKTRLVTEYMHECVGASQGYHGVYRAAQTVLSRC